MSENIESNLRQFKNVDAPTEMSNFARKSEQTKVSRVAEVSAPIPVGDTSRAISTFSMVFDRLYSDFSESLVKEYA